MSNVIESIERAQLRKVPRFKAGDTVRVHFQVIEGQRRRVQVYEGIVIKRQGSGARETFTVRKQSFGVGVERSFPLHSPKIEKIEVTAARSTRRRRRSSRTRRLSRRRRLPRQRRLRRPRRKPRRPRSSPKWSSLTQPRPKQSPSPQANSRRLTRSLLSAAVKATGQKLLKFDRTLGARFVAGTDEAGRGSLAGPLVVAGVLLDYALLKEHRVRPLTYLNDSKQCTEAQREELFHAVLGCALKVAVRVIPPGDIDRNGLHKSNLAGLRAMLHALAPPAEACLVDGFKLGPSAPEHTAVIDGDTKSAAIAAASIVAKVTRDRLMRRLDALYPAYGFAQHVGYITPAHSAVVRERGPCAVHRLSFQALCYR